MHVFTNSVVKKLSLAVSRSSILRSALLIVGLGMCACFGIACHNLPPVISSDVLPSEGEQKMGENYVGKSFMLTQWAYLYPRTFQWVLRTEAPSAPDRPVSVPPGTRFVVNRVEMAQGKAGATTAAILGTPFYGLPEPGDVPTIDVLYVDLHVETKTYRNAQIHLDRDSKSDHPSFRPE